MKQIIGFVFSIAISIAQTFQTSTGANSPNIQGAKDVHIDWSTPTSAVNTYKARVEGVEGHITLPMKVQTGRSSTILTITKDGDIIVDMQALGEAIAEGRVKVQKTK